MPPVEIRAVTHSADVGVEEALQLYVALGWTAYTRDPALVAAGLTGASFVAVAREDGRLIGLLRAVSDDASIAYVQDVLVHPDAQRRGVGAALMAAAVERYRHVRQHVLLTDDEPGQRAFYESLGYRETRDLGEGTLRAFVRFS
jgi:GNAT superfamily N-acetyltransferase